MKQRNVRAPPREPEKSTMTLPPVYELLKHRLTRGELLPGTVLTIRGLAKEVGVGAMPVREALLRLEAQGALELLENRSVRVPLQSLESFEQLCAVRILLEGNAAAAAAMRATPEQLEDMTVLNEDFEAAMEQSNPLASLDANEKFHFAVYRAAGNPTLVRQIELLWLQCGPYISALFRYYALVNELSQDPISAGFGHRHLLEAVQAKSASGAKKGVEEDIGFSLDTFRRICRKAGHSPQSIRAIIGLLPG